MRFAAIVNTSAGTTSRIGKGRLRAILSDALGPQLSSIKFVGGRSLCAACDAAIAAKPDALLILGGDGTCRSAAAQAVKTNVPIVLLPGGTMNVLPKRIWGERTLERVLEQVAKGDVRDGTLDMGTANGTPFFVAAAFGLVPVLARVRERWRKAGGLREHVRAAASVPRLSGRIFKPSVRFTHAERDTARAAALVVSVGDADRLLPWGGADDDIRRFECVSLDAEGWIDLVRLAWHAATVGDWREDARIGDFAATEISAHSGRRTWVTLDGEPHAMSGPVILRYRRDALRILAPHPKQADDIAA